MSGEVSENGYVVVHRQLGALCGLARKGFYWQNNWPMRTPVVFAFLKSAEACAKTIVEMCPYELDEFEIREYVRREVEDANVDHPVRAE